MPQTRLAVNAGALPPDLRAGMGHLAGEYPLDLCAGGENSVVFRPGAARNSFRAARGSRPEIVYDRQSDAFRALGQLLAARPSADRDPIAETSAFDTLGVMVDCSRNGVLRPETVKALLRRCALMGINTFMLYTEDVYELPGEPFFGYLRGAYTAEELRDLDDYADALGIEMFPCIQTLAHLEQMLQWQHAYHDITDTEHIMLVGEEKTYRLVEKMIAAVSGAFRSRRIHLGMDEAHALGTGVYLRKNGLRRTYDLMTEHLDRVCALCARRGLRPMIWSDMFFRIGSASHDYYDPDIRIPDEVRRRIPENLDLVAWDYYHREPDFHAGFIRRHKELGRDPVIAPGAWNWRRFWSALPYAFPRIESFMTCARRENIREAFITTWGDDGTENDIFSALPALQYYAEFAARDRVDMKDTARNLRASCGIKLEDYLLAARLDIPPTMSDPEDWVSNISKWLLWDDPLLGLCEPHRADIPAAAHYRRLARDLAQRVKAGDPASRRLRFPAQIAAALAARSDLRPDMVKAYRAGDRAELGRLAREDLVRARREIRKLWRVHRDMWLETYKPFGLEVIEIRYGGLLARLDSLSARVASYLAGRIDRIPEFETDLHPFRPSSPEKPAQMGPYSRFATAAWRI